MKVKSIFLDTVAELPREPIPTKVTKRVRKNGKLIDIAVLRKAK